MAGPHRATHRFGPRTGLMSGVILVAALAAMLLELPLAAGAALVLGTWVVVSLAEIVVSRREAARAAGAAPTAGHAVAAEPAAEAEHAAEPASEPPREWNVWELERRARERAGVDPRRDEEWASIILYLRRFATPDGTIPRDFDVLVRRSFHELVEAVR